MRFWIFVCLFLMSCNMVDNELEFSDDVIAPKNVTVGFYNVENLFDTEDEPGVNDNDFTPEGYKKWTLDRYYEKLDNISRVILDMNKNDWPVVIGLSEVENKAVLEDLISHKDLINANYGIVHYDSPDERGIDVALLYRKEFFSLKNSNNIVINNPDFPNSKTRAILHVDGEFFNGENFHFFVNHWSSRRDGTLETEAKRLFQADVLKKWVDRVSEDASNKIVVMGDFNDYPTDKSIKQVLNAGVGSESLYNLAYALHMQDKGTINYKNDWGMFDQFMVSKNLFNTGLHLKSKQLKILDKEYLIWKGKKPNRTYGGDKYYGGFSDHLPIYINLEL
ncbi:MAG: endonuclease/exonuclease/phosphatase family protein [Chitinophagales bacterium]